MKNECLFSPELITSQNETLKQDLVLTDHPPGPFENFINPQFEITSSPKTTHFTKTKIEIGLITAIHLI